jgi:hypothetical protein
VDVIVANSNPTIAAAKQASATIPIVMVYGVDPVGTGFIASLRRPGAQRHRRSMGPLPGVVRQKFRVVDDRHPETVAGRGGLESQL